MDHDHAVPLHDVHFWNERYLSSSRLWSGNPNPQLVAEVADLSPGRALDAGCGEGADAIWLARRGWEVMATDISDVALERAAEHAQETDAEAAARIQWRQADLLLDPPDSDSFDLASVRAGGTLLVVGHHPSDMTTGVHRPPTPEVFYTGDDVAELFDEAWAILVSESRPRPATTPDGVAVTIHDAVLRAERRAH